MTSFFADSFYFLALLNANDQAHSQAVEFSRQTSVKVVTTTWVLTEVADALSAPFNRPRFLDLYDSLHGDPMADIISPTLKHYHKGIELFRHRPDKYWTLTDCISFVIMSERKIKQALTADKHFEQAGFIALLK